MRFEWDERKARRNAAKHGVTFAQAVTAFDDPDRWYGLDMAHSSASELREVVIGMSEGGMVVISFTRRPPDNVHRIISARRAGRRDRRKYEEDSGNQISVEDGPAGDTAGDGGSPEGS